MKNWTFIEHHNKQGIYHSNQKLIIHTFWYFDGDMFGPTLIFFAVQSFQVVVGVKFIGRLRGCRGLLLRWWGMQDYCWCYLLGRFVWRCVFGRGCEGCWSHWSFLCIEDWCVDFTFDCESPGIFVATTGCKSVSMPASTVLNHQKFQTIHHL